MQGWVLIASLPSCLAEYGLHWALVTKQKIHFDTEASCHLWVEPWRVKQGAVLRFNRIFPQGANSHCLSQVTSNNGVWTRASQYGVTLHQGVVNERVHSTYEKGLLIRHTPSKGKGMPRQQ